MLLPRMTQSQRNAISSPATGLMIYQTDNSSGFYYNSGTSGSPVWAMVGSGSGWSLTGNSGTNAGTNFIGTTDGQPLMFKVNNQKAGRYPLMVRCLSAINAGIVIGSYKHWIQCPFFEHEEIITLPIGDYALYSKQQAAVTPPPEVSTYSNTTGFNTLLRQDALFQHTRISTNTANGVCCALFQHRQDTTIPPTGYAALYSTTIQHCHGIRFTHTARTLPMECALLQHYRKQQYCQRISGNAGTFKF